MVHTIRYQLKACRIHLSWDGLRRALEGQDRITVELKCAGGQILHMCKARRPESRQQRIYDAFGISDLPGRTEKTVVLGFNRSPAKLVVP